MDHKRAAADRDAVDVGGFEAGIGDCVECRVGMRLYLRHVRMTPSRVVSAAPTVATPLVL
jgi:hypothetical protein